MLSNFRKKTRGQKSCRQEQPKQQISAQLLCKFSLSYPIIKKPKRIKQKPKEEKRGSLEKEKIPLVAALSLASWLYIQKCKEMENAKKKKKKRKKKWKPKFFGNGERERKMKAVAGKEGKQ